MLDEVELGPDLVLGRSGRTVYFFPLRSISEATGLEPRVSISESLGGLLSQQKQPVKLRFEAGAELHSAWLLTWKGSGCELPRSRGHMGSISEVAICAKRTVFARRFSMSIRLRRRVSPWSIGLLFLAIASVGVVVFSLNKPLPTYLVAKRDLVPGQSIQSADLEAAE